MNSYDFTPSEIAINDFIDRAVAFLEKYFVNILLGAAPAEAKN